MIVYCVGVLTGSLAIPKRTPSRDPTEMVAGFE